MSNYEKLDSWSLRAQKEAYPARSVYKLQELDEKFGLLPQKSGRKKPDFKVLDLGAAPGSWSLYVLRKLGASCSLVSCDLSPLSRNFDRGLFDGANFFFKQGDIFLPEIAEEIIGKGPYSLVLSDMAPATSGNRTLDTARSGELAEAALSYAEKSLTPGGNLCVKIFQGGGTDDVIKKIRPLFKTVKTFKPKACRPASFEIYLAALGKKTG
jgi:23S rRNA (uridine2552-2'-O)-methyltransferase